MTISLKQLIEQSGYHIFFPVVDKFLDINPKLANFTSLPSSSVKNSGQLLSSSEIQETILNVSQKTNKNIAILPFKPSAKIEYLCRRHHWLYLANHFKINRLLEDKIKFSNFCRQNKIPCVPHLISRHSEENFRLAQKQFGKQIVVQTKFGWSGKSTQILNSYLETDNLRFSSPVKYMPLLNGFTLTNNCCLYHQNVFQSPPGLQYTGIPQLTINPFATVGRQWPCFASSKVINSVFSLTNNLGRLMSEKFNYRGFFGLDFFVDKEQNTYLLECNPRLTASFSFYTNLELSQHLNPLFYYHLAEFLHLNYSFNPEIENLRFDNQKIIGSEIVRKDNLSNTIKRIQKNYPLSFSPDPVSIPPEILAKLL